jgi:methionyl-tRNA formyltransferase
VTPAAPWRVAIITSVPEVAAIYSEVVTSLGHQPVLLIVPRWVKPHVHPYPSATELLASGPDGLDIVFPNAERSLPRILRGYEIDLGLCTGLSWLLSAETIATPPLGIVNGHPSPLPRYRGPFPIAWQVRNGETEIGLSYHLMDESFDTGNVLAQTSVPIGPDDSDAELNVRLATAAPALLATVFERLAAGDRGEPQAGGEYQSHFEDEYVALDLTKTAAETHRQVRAWSFVPPRLRHGPLHDGVRVAKSSLVEVDGATRLECADGPLWVVESEPLEVR